MFSKIAREQPALICILQGNMYITRSICLFLNNNPCDVKKSLPHVNFHAENAPKLYSFISIFSYY